ncbi:ATP-binding Cassette (ABC) Superfamily [Phytophthora cinnamomi]|uniref:ATP-binding Cassette (ABC) Superfamily n=1 Tax=Phytophthora cinnamomi TaxID=4785 RepID=UPI00355A0D7E|nr:ATP-binding Cassette (ABC) Superfamily [Phytophthora cinnamomi]
MSEPSTPATPASVHWGETMMDQGPEALHNFMAETFKAATGGVLPQMEVRFDNVSISADVTVTREVTAASELPTLYNVVARALANLNPIKKKVVRKEVIKSVSGVLKPGTITLLLGQPGSGKTSLMRILSGQFPLKKNITVEGEMTYNGLLQKEIAKRLPQFVAYVTQYDRHFHTLTVRETLEFAYAFCGGGLSKHGEEMLSRGTPEANAKALAAAKAVFSRFPDVIIEQLGLQICQDTVIGNAMHRGVSGGERKRVTTGEMQFGQKYMTLMDEISTGLDSAATYDIIKTQRSIAKNLHRTILIALLQPAPEVFELFDNVLIMNEGEMMYNGPRHKVVPYFETLGFKCPHGRDVADYLLDLGTNQQYKYQTALPPGMAKHPRLASEFAKHFRESSLYADIVDELATPIEKEIVERVGDNMDPMPEFRQTLWENIRTLTWRQLIIILRNAAFIRVRTFMVVVMGLIYGSTFYNVDPTNVQVMLGVIFQATLFLSLGQASQIPTFMEARSIFYKQRGANFYRTSAWVIANSVALVPQALGEILVFATLVYWMCGFAATASAYIIYLILLLLTNLVFASWFFCLSAMSPNLDIAKPMSTFSIVFFILFAGFVITKDQTPGWFIWVYWINPIAWCLRGLSVNEYRSSAYDVCEYGDINYCTEYGRNMGEYYLSQYGVPSDKFWIWTGILFMIVAYIFFMVLGCYVLEYHRYEVPENIQLLPKTVTDESDMEKRGGDYALAVTPKGNSSTNTRTDAGGSGEVVMDVPQREKNFVPCTIAWKDLWYSVPSPHDRKETLQLLKGINGYAEPGSLTALMGSSGAGKTTLMDVIAGRKTGGTIEGKIYLNGYEANDLAIRRATGYCEQMDIHSEGSTIREALTFSAFLRQDSTVPTAKKYDSVNECLDLLDMHDIADQIVRGSSQEQMKRLTIGVELVAQPSILFLDEPTSGLDAHSAKLIMDGVRKVADSGRTIVCTIHQPSSDVFFLFDHLLLLKRGGESVFVGELGEECQNLVNYLESIEGVTPLPDKQNPATWMLEVIGAGVGHQPTDVADFVQLFKESKEAQHLMEYLERPGVTRPTPELPEMVFKKKRAASPFTQMWFLIQRFVVMYWRTPTYNLTRFVIAVGLALISGLTYINSEFVSYQGINGGVGMVFMTTLFMGIATFTGALPLTALDRAAFYRERASQTYNSLWYFVASTVVEIPYVFFACLLFTVIFYPMVGFQSFASSVLYWINLSLFVLTQAYLAQVLIYAFPSIEVSAIVGVLINSIFLLFAGFNPPSASIPSGYKWLYTITPQRFPLAILSALVFCDCPDEPTWNETLGAYENVGSNIGCQPVTDLPVTIDHITVKAYVESVFKYKYDDIWANFGYVFIVLGIFRALALFSLRYINHTQR